VLAGGDEQRLEVPTGGDEGDRVARREHADEALGEP
jgi:hypothetical protein